MKKWREADAPAEPPTPLMNNHPDDLSAVSFVERRSLSFSKEIAGYVLIRFKEPGSAGKLLTHVTVFIGNVDSMRDGLSGNRVFESFKINLVEQTIG